MKTFHRICIADYSVTDGEGTTATITRGREYLTSEERDGRVMVFTGYWFLVPITVFAGELEFTK